MKKPSLSYQDAGVSIDAGNTFVEKIKRHIKKTHRAEVIGGLGGFAGLFELDLSKYSKPILVSATDGVGTKLKLAFELAKYDTIGIDCVAMCVNDLICCGAEPLFFLDYLATGKLSVEVSEQIILGITQALSEINCTLIGGETAEMPSMYPEGEFDVAGFAVGAVNKPDILPKTNIKAGDIVIGIPSSGVHSNGFSLVRKILEVNQISLSDTCGFDKPIGEVLLTPTRLYVNPILKLLPKIKGAAHITGGGLVENVPRILPENCGVKIAKQNIPILPIFTWLQEQGQVVETEMWRVFNMGIGMVLVVEPNNADHCLNELKKLNYPGIQLGEITSSDKPGVSLV